MADEQRPRLISLTEVDGSDAAPLRVPLWRRVLCVLTGGHRVNRVIGLRYGVIVECGRCGWREARWNAALAMPKPAPGYHPGGRVDPPAGVALAPFAEVDLAPFQEAMSRTVRLLAEVTQLPNDLDVEMDNSSGRFVPSEPRTPYFPAGMVGAVIAGTGIQSVLAHAAEIERLTLHLRMACPPDRFDGAMAEVEELMATTWMPRAEALQRVLAEGRFVSTSATYPLVAPEDPQVAQSGERGWLGRWIHRKRRTP